MGTLLTSPHEVPSTEEMKEYMGKATSPEAAMDYLKVLVYGKPKRGKTRFLGTWPNILILDFDHGAGVLARAEGFKGKIVRVESWEDVRMWYWILARAKHRFQAVAWDTGTMAQEIALRSVLQEKAEKHGDGKDPYHAEQNDYGRSARLLRTWIGMYVSLPMHFLITAHEREGEAPDEATGDEMTVWMVPDFQAAVRGYVQGLVGAIGYAYRTVDKETKQKQFKIAFERKSTNAEDRYGLLPRVLDPPTYENMMRYYKGEK